MFAFIGLFHSFFKIVWKNHLSSHSLGNTIFHPVADQLAKVFDFFSSEICFLVK